MKIGAIILLGGRGERYGSEVPKQFLKLSGKKVYLHTLEQFLRADRIDKVICVCPEIYVDEVRLEVPEGVLVCPGGESRQASSHAGLLALGKCDYVLIHDAVRPFVTQEIIQRNIDLVQDVGAVDTCIPATDTMVYSTEGREIESIPTRAHYYRGQTPQTFKYNLILEAHKKASTEGATDDCTLVRNLGHRIAIAQGSESNIKITGPLDLYIAEQIIRLEKRSPTEPTSTLAGKRFVITGGAGEIGAAIAKELAQAGAEAITLSKSEDGDLSNPDQAEETFTTLGPLDGVINCTGFLLVKAFHNTSPAEIETTLSSNLSSVIYACRFAHIKGGGHIINIASSSYTRGRKDYAVYSAAKAAVVNFSQALALEKPDLHINTIAPSRTNSPMRAANFPNEAPTELLQPSEIAHETLRLLKTVGVTGTTIDIKKETR